MKTPKLLNRAKLAACNARGSDLSGSPRLYNSTLLIKPTGKYLTDEQDIKIITEGLEKLKLRLSISQVIFEHGQHRYHIHALIENKKKNIYAKQYQTSGLYVGIQPLKNITAYELYCLKEKGILDSWQEYAFASENDSP